MLQHNSFFPRHTKFPCQPVDGTDSLHQMTQHFPLKGVSGRNPQLIGLDFIDFFHIMQNHSGHHQFPVQVRIYLTGAFRHHKHAFYVVQQPSHLCVMVFLCRRIIHQFLLIVRQFPNADISKILILKSLRSAVNVLIHIRRLFRRSFDVVFHNQVVFC